MTTKKCPGCKQKFGTYRAEQKYCSWLCYARECINSGRWRRKFSDVQLAALAQKQYERRMALWSGGKRPRSG